jgi:hypothetical protein
MQPTQRLSPQRLKNGDFGNVDQPRMPNLPKTRLQGQFAPFRVRMDNPEITFDTNWPPFAVAPADVTQQGSVIRFFEEASSGKT